MESFCLKQISNTEDEAPIIICLNVDLLDIGKETFPTLKKFRYLSRQHARLTKRNEDWFIEDLNSKLGTYVNFQRITKMHKLKNGDIIGFGVKNSSSRGFICTFCLADDRIKNESIYSVNDYTILNIDNDDRQRLSNALIANDDSKTSSANLNKEVSFVSQSTLDNDVKMKKCTVRLIRCDSKYFKLPSDVKSISKSFKRAYSESFKKKNTKKQKKTSDKNIPHIYSSQAYIPIHSSTVKNVNDANNVLLANWNIQKSINNSYPKPSNTLTAVVKPFNKIQNVENVSGYSETEEVIYIPDDDSHLDFYSSEPIKSDTAYESDGIDFTLLDDLPDENDIQLISDSNKPETIESINDFIHTRDNMYIKKEKDESLNSGHNDETDIYPNTESISDIASGNLEEGDFSGGVESGNESNNLNDASNAELMRDLVLHKNVTDDVLSDHDSNGSDISLHSIIMYPTSYKKSLDQKVEDSKLEEYKKHKKAVSVSKTKLTEPKPMQPRPKYLRGKEEVFVPAQDEEFDKNLYPENLMDSIKSHSSAENMQDKLAKRSDIKLKRKEKLKAIEIDKAIKSKEQGTNSIIKQTETTVKKRGERFSSRSQLLTASIIEDGSENCPNIHKKYSKNNAKASHANSGVLTVDKLSQDVENSYSSNSEPIHKVAASNNKVKNNFKDRLSRKSIHHSTLIGKSNKSNNSTQSKKSKKNQTEVDHNSQLSTPSGKQNRDKKSVHSKKKSKNYQPNNDSSSAHGVSSKRIGNPLSNNPSSNLYNTSSQAIESVLSKANIDPRLMINKSAHQLKNLEVLNYSKPDEKFEKKPTSVVAGSSYSGSGNKSINEVLEKVVGLKVTWIDEQRRQKLPPPVIYKDSGGLPLSFYSYEQYVSAFQPMLMLEIWEEVCRSAQPIIDSRYNCQKFYFTINKSQQKGSLLVHDCESLINQNCPEPNEGNIVILAIKTLDVKEVHIVLGYISKHYVVKSYKREHISPQWNEVVTTWTNGAKFHKFSVVTKFSHLTPKYRDIMKGNVVVSIKKKFHLVDALEKFKNSHLRDDVLRPDMHSFALSNHPTSYCSEMKFSASQQTVIDAIGGELHEDNGERKIFLIQGGPGTGKSHTILGLLEHFIYSNSYSKRTILITVPSSVAVNEIAVRIIDFNERLSYKKKEIKFVCIGTGKEMSDEIRDYSLDVRVTAALKNMHAKGRSEQNVLQQNEMLIKKIQILQESHVIISTLRNCWDPAMFAKQIKFAACIIDDATQCTEIEILQPLVLDIHKLILFGDDNQLPPTVHSQIAIRKHFDRSMFERFQLYISKTFPSSPIFTLVEQFRMHSDICKFPSQYFYGGKLVTESDYSLKYPILPYAVYDVLKCDNIPEELGAVTKLCESILSMEPFATIGVIVPHKEQVDSFEKAVTHFPRYKNIEVNVVDGFQGRQKDIIIISCLSSKYLAKSIEFLCCKRRLNVAITRARHSLIFLANVSILCQYPHWDALIYNAKQRGVLTIVPECKNIIEVFYSRMLNREYDS